MINALIANSSGGANTAIGKEALYSNTTSSSSTAVGNYSLKNSNGFYNTAVGTYSLYSNTSGARNVGIGLNSLFTNTTGSYNTAIGYETYASANNASNQTIIGYQATGQADNSVVLGNDYYETPERIEVDISQNVPPLGIGDGTIIEKAIIDKNVRIGRHVKIVNELGLTELPEDAPFTIRDGVVVVPKNAILHNGWKLTDKAS